MKYKGILVIVLCVPTLANANCHVRVEPKWDNLEQTQKKEKMFGGKLMLVGSITFRKQCKDCIKIDKLVLEWHGKQLDTLCGSLYKKYSEKEFVPLQENLICDALWNKANQNLVLDFESQETLSAVNVFYVVLTVPEGIEQTLKDGHFTLRDTTLPDQINFADKKLDLALGTRSH